MRWYQVRRASKDRHEWAAAVIMLPVVLAIFVLIRVISPGWSVTASALLGAALGVGLVRSGNLITDRLRRRGKSQQQG
jgi:hypothetical protein